MANWEDRREPWKAQNEDARGPYDIDYGRVIHSASFRRLQGKTQILNLGDSDFYRTRLTHSMEVAQIGSGIVRQLKKSYPEHPCCILLPEQNLVQSICLAHDIGHPPFGHGGEVALNYCMREAGGFEANAQSLRILSKLEKFSKNSGANLTRRTLLGILKYPISYSSAQNPSLKPKLADHTTAISILDRKASKPPKCYHDSEQDVVDWMLEGLPNGDKHLLIKPDIAEQKKHRKSLHKSLDCTIMDAADDIAYGIHDLEDVIAMGLVSEAQFWDEVPEEKCGKYLDALKEKYPGEFSNDVYDGFVSKLFSDGATRKRQIGRLVHHFMTHVEIHEADGFDEEMLKYRVRIAERYRPFLDALREFVANKVIRNASVQHLEFKGQQMVLAVFEAFASDPTALLPEITLKKFNETGDTRVICDHIGGMTDHFLLRTYERLFSPRMGSVFDRL